MYVKGVKNERANEKKGRRWEWGMDVVAANNSDDKTMMGRERLLTSRLLTARMQASQSIGYLEPAYIGLANDIRKTADRFYGYGKTRERAFFFFRF